MQVNNTDLKRNKSFLRRDRLLFITMLYYGFQGSIVEFIPVLQSSLRIVTLCVDIILIAATFSMYQYLSAAEKKMYRKATFVLFFISSITFVLFESFRILVVFNHLNGLRYFLILLGLFIYFEVRFSALDREVLTKRISRFLFFFALVQIPLSIRQYMIHGATTDMVGGSFFEGGTGILTLLLFMIFFFLIHERHRSTTNIIHWGKAFLYIPLLIPSFINETKITLILIPIVLLLSINLKRIKGALIYLIGGFIFISIFFQVYSTTTESNTTDLFTIDFIQKYMFTEDVNYTLFERSGESFDIPRFAKITLLIAYWKFDAVHILFGQSYGALKGKNTLGFEYSDDLMYLTYGSKNVIFDLLIQGGMVVIVFIFWIFFHNTRSLSTIPDDNRKRVHLFIVILFLIILLYNDPYFSPFFSWVFIFLLTWSRSSPLPVPFSTKVV
jgi:hypothetical protein